MFALLCVLLMALLSSCHAADVTTLTKPTITSITGCRGQLTSCQPQLALTLTGPTFADISHVAHQTHIFPFQIQLSVRVPGFYQTIYSCDNVRFGRLPLSLVCLLPQVDKQTLGHEFSVRVIDQSVGVESVETQFDEASDWQLALSYSSVTPAIDPDAATIEELRSINKTISHSLMVWQIAAIILSVTLTAIVMAILVPMCRKKSVVSANEAAADHPLLNDIPFPRASHQVHRPRTNPSPFAPVMRHSNSTLSRQLAAKSSASRSASSASARPESMNLAPSPPIVRVYPSAFGEQHQPGQSISALEMGSSSYDMM